MNSSWYFLVIFEVSHCFRPTTLDRDIDTTVDSEVRWVDNLIPSDAELMFPLPNGDTSFAGSTLPNAFAVFLLTASPQQLTSQSSYEHYSFIEPIENGVEDVVISGQTPLNPNATSLLVLGAVIVAPPPAKSKRRYLLV